MAQLSPSSSMNSPPSWLVEMHKELWGKHDMFGRIFRTADLNKTDFIDLQNQLHELNPYRSSKSYIASGVLATKTDFLRTRSRSIAPRFASSNDNLVPQLVV